MKLYQVDAFTTQPFSGNPAGVCLLPASSRGGQARLAVPAPVPEAWMQAVAREMNLSETAFLVPWPGGGPGEYHLRWFTPLKEVRLCGHATLASAHILWESGALSVDRAARFHTLSGELTAARSGDWIEMDFPARFGEPDQPPPGLVEALGFAHGVNPKQVIRREQIYLIEVESEAAIRAAQPDFSALSRLPVRSVIITARAETTGPAAAGYDFVSRYFAPAVGINEDPVTGSAHCMLAPYWAAKLGKTEMSACQVSARGGELHVRLAGEGDSAGSRVILCGQAVTVLACELAESAAYAV